MAEKRQLEHEDYTTVVDIARQLLKISGYPRPSYFLFGSLLSFDIAALAAWARPVGDMDALRPGLRLLLHHRLLFGDFRRLTDSKNIKIQHQPEEP